MILRYAARRLIAFLPALLLATAAIFGILRLLPGDVVLTILADTPHTLEMREALREELGLNAPPAVQYLRWLGDLTDSSFGGKSLSTGETIGSLAASQFPVTLLISAYSLFVSAVFGFAVGLWRSFQPNRIADALFKTVSLAGVSIPNVLTASLLLFAMLRLFRWSPPIIYSSPVEHLGDHIRIVLWPVVILSWEFGSHIARAIHGAMQEVMKSDFFMAAKGRGVGRLSLALRHSIPFAAGSVLNILGTQFGVLLGGTLVLESVFGIPGLGRGLVQAAVARDLTVVQSYATVLVGLFLVINLLVDIGHLASDPRLRLREAETT